MAAYAPKKDEVYGYQTLYRELGYFITRREQYDRALRYFDEALKKTPDDKRALTGRAFTRAKNCQYPGALEDIAKALNQDPDDLITLARKALTTYLSCEFEEALIQNYRCLPKRKKPDHFVMGVMHCAEAIENCTGERAGRPLRDHYKVIRKLAWKRAREAEKPFQPQSKYKKKKKKKTKKKKKKVREPVTPLVAPKSSKRMKGLPSTGAEGDIDDDQLSQLSTPITIKVDPEFCIRDSLHSVHTESDDIPPPAQHIPYRPLQHYTTNIENYMAEKYLDSMYLDKIFLKGLKYDMRISCPNKIGSKKILQFAREGHKMLSFKQELLRTRRPFYFIKYQEATMSGKLRERQENELRKMQAFARKDADALIDKITQSIEEKQTRLALEYAEKLKQYCDSKAKKILPEREEYLQKMYVLVSQAYLDMKRLNKDQFEWDQEKRIYNMLGQPLSTEPSTDSVINQFKGVFVDYKKQIVVFEDRMRKATNSQEMAWLYHELARYHTELKQYELARVYCRKCNAEGRRCDNLAWILNAMIMIARINVMQHNRNDAKVELNDALVIANRMKNEDIKEYIEKCLSVVEKIDFEDVCGPKVLEKREKQIIEMMAESEMKDEAAYLFRKMSAMPAARRMSVMPGVKLEDQKEPTASARKLSIMPTAKRPEDEQVEAKKPPPQEEGEGKGVGFMELIQYHVE